MSNYYFLIDCKLFIILIDRNGTNEKKNTSVKEGFKEKTFKSNFFVNYCEKISDSREFFLLNEYISTQKLSTKNINSFGNEVNANLFPR